MKEKPAVKTLYLLSGFFVNIVISTISKTAKAHGLTESASARAVILKNKEFPTILTSS